MTENEIEKLKKSIEKSKNILLLTHINPDGDGIGSGLALMNFLLKQGKKVSFLNRDPLPSIYQFLPGSEKYRQVKKIKENYDLAIILECPELERIGDIINLKEQVKFTINIDHHIGNKMYADLNIVDPKAAAVGIQVYKLLKGLNQKIDKNMAICIYTSIVIDTGSFKYSNTTVEVHQIAAELIKAGAEPEKISSEVYATTKNSLKLFGSMILKMKIVKNIGWSEITKEMFKKNKAIDSDTDNFVNSISSIKGIDIAILFKEYSKKQVKVSFRSKNGYDVNVIAKKFGGGGHKHAAGCLFKMPLKEVKKIVIKEIFERYK